LFQLIFPMVLGNGKGRFADGAMPAGLKLVNRGLLSDGRDRRQLPARRRGQDRRLRVG
jgi:hypothetical protein